MKMNLIRIAFGAALVVGLTLPITTATFADTAADCHARLQSARARLDHDSGRYGPDSRKVERDRDRLEDARRWCRDHHSEWDHSLFDVGVYIKH
jgi:hypothetical protein